MTNQQSQEYLSTITGWKLENIHDLSEDTWVAIAATTHHKARMESEQTFCVIAKGFNHFEFDLHEIPELAKWSFRTHYETA